MHRPLMLSLVLLTSCGPKEVAPAAPPVGWHAEEGWKGMCYFPPDYDGVEAQGGVSARRTARQDALEGMMGQWEGKREDGVTMDEGIIADVENTVLGRPETIEQVSRQNLEYCKQVMGAGASTDAWESWLKNLPGKLTAGECLVPLRNTYFDYLEIGWGWQFPVEMCAGDRARITATSADKFRITKEGEWITAAGHEGKQATGEGWPCTNEGCWEGMLVGRFTTQDGFEEVFPIGITTEYRAQAHGTLTISLNDNAWYDNAWFKSGAIEDHTGITIEPAD